MRSNSDGNKPIEAYASRALGTIGIIIAFAGCASPRPYVGRWEGTQALLLAPETDRDTAATLRRVVLTVKPNSRFLLVEKGLPREGELDADSLMADSEAGRPIARASLGTVRREQGEVVLTLAAGTIVRLRAAKPKQ